VIPEILLGISLCVAVLTCITLYGQRENLARENDELKTANAEANQLLDSVIRRTLASRFGHDSSEGSTGDMDLDRLVGDRNSDDSEGV
jgi:hypothetical protein